MQAVVLGFGVNVQRAAYPPELGDRVTALEPELGRHVDRAALLVASLTALAARQQWHAMPPLITDAMIDAFAVSGTPDELPHAIHARYNGLLDRVNLYKPFVPGEPTEFWRQFLHAFRA